MRKTHPFVEVILQATTTANKISSDNAYLLKFKRLTNPSKSVIIIYEGSYMKNKLYGFTLAEGLIAMAIVGVIAALTIPGIVANYQTQSYLTGLKKAYADLQQNLSIMQADNYRIKRLNASMLARGYVGFGNTGKTIDETAGQFLKTYYKINRDCGTDTQPCFADAYGSIDGDGDENFSCSKGYSVL